MKTVLKAMFATIFVVIFGMVALVFLVDGEDYEEDENFNEYYSYGNDDEDDDYDSESFYGNEEEYDGEYFYDDEDEDDEEEYDEDDDEEYDDDEDEDSDDDEDNVVPGESSGTSYANNGSNSGNGNSNSGRTQRTSSPKMWAIVVANTLDENIGKEDIIDNKAVMNELNSIVKALGIEHSIQNITGKKMFDKEYVASRINAINPGPDDIVLFWYSGHGFRWDNQKDQYPCFAMADEDDDLETHYIAASDVYNTIVGKGARLNLVFADCCNSKIGANKPRGAGNTVSSRSSSASLDRLKDLFLHSEGSTLVAAAKPGEYASAISDYGSALTQAVLASLRSEVSSDRKDETSWTRIVNSALSSAQKMSEEVGGSQHGIKKMDVKSVKK